MPPAFRRTAGLILALGALLALPALTAGCGVLVPLPVTSPLPTPSPTLAPEAPLVVLFLDVGQADATLIRSPGGCTMLIDGGNSALDADQVILPALQAWDAQGLDVLVVTHPDQDHIGGLPKIVESIPVGRVVLTGQVHPTQTYEHLLTAVRDRGVPAVRARAGTNLDFDPALSTLILGPIDALVESDDTNNASVVIRMTYRQVSFLFPGDAEETEEAIILDGSESVTAQVLKVGHHGSRSSTSAAWLGAVAPEVAVISAGAGNRYEHPHLEILERLSQLDIATYRTDEQGTITIRSDGNTYQVWEER